MVDITAFLTTDQCTKCGVVKQRPAKARDEALLARANEQATREADFAKLKRERQFELSKGVLNADLEKVRRLNREIAAVSNEDEMPLGASISLLVLVVIGIIFLLD